MDEETNGTNDDGEYDEAAELDRVMRRLSKYPSRGIDIEIAVLKEKTWQIGREVIQIRKLLVERGRRQNALWDDYQQRLGERALTRWWLALLTLAVGATGTAVIIFHH